MTSFTSAVTIYQFLLLQCALLTLVASVPVYAQRYTLVPNDTGPGSALVMTWCTFLPGTDSLLANDNDRLGVWKRGEHWTPGGNVPRVIKIDSSVFTNYPRIEFTDDGKRFLYYGNRAMVVDRATWKPVALLQEIPYPQFATYTPDEREIVGIDQAGPSGRNPSRVLVWDANTGALIRSLGPDTMKIKGVAVSRDGKTLLFATLDGELSKLTYPEGELIWKKQLFEYGTKNIRFNPSGDRLLVIHYDNSASEWDVAEGTLIRRYLAGDQFGNSIVSAEYRSDGAEIVTLSTEGRIRIYSTVTGARLADKWTFPYNYPNYAEFTPDGKGILTSSDEGSRIWDIRDSSSPHIVAGSMVWEKVNDTLESTITCLFENDGVLFAGSSRGLFRSTDQGVEWSNAIFPWNRFVALGENKGYLFAATSGMGTYRSSDNGLSWSGPLQGLQDLGGVLSLATNGDMLFAGTGDNGVYRSTDNGDTWTQIINGMRNYRSVRCFQAYKGYFFAGTIDGLQRTTNNGDLWTPVHGVLGPYRSPYRVALLHDFLFIATDQGVCRWDGKTDTTAFSYLTGSIRGIATYGPLLFAATGASGVLVSSDAGITWEHINTGLTNLKMTALAQFNGKLFATAEGGGMWTLDLREVLDVKNDIAPQLPSSDLQVYPNPAAGQTSIRFTLAKPSPVTLTIVDAMGGIVSQPVTDLMYDTGGHQIILDTRGLAAGIYLCSMTIKDSRKSGWLLIVR